MSRVLELICHSDTPAHAIGRVWVEWEAATTGITIRYYAEAAEALKLGAPKASARTAELWMTTCCELFLKPDDGEGYCEFNFAPSTQWAAYAFDGYREGMTDLPCPVPPQVERGGGGDSLVLSANIALGHSLLAQGARVGISAVIEEKDGTKSYWALAHPPGKPDFHHPACFALELPASSKP